MLHFDITKNMIKDTAKTIVCYGDSNTWGNIPGTFDRYPRSKRWPYILQNLLGENFEVVSEGLPARTFVVIEDEKPYHSGITQLKSILKTHKPIDAIVVMLGTNELKDRFNLTSKDVTKHLEQTIKLIQEENIKNILIICPPHVADIEEGILRSDFIKNKDEIKKYPELFDKIAKEYKCSFLNANDFITSSKIDGFHLDPKAHQKLAEVLKEQILNLNL